MLRLTIWDKSLIMGLLLTASMYLGFDMYGSKDIDTVLVQVDGVEAIRRPLSEDGIFFVEGPIGETEIEIKDKRVRVVDSPCKRKICTNTGWIDKTYQTIICMPNRVVVSLLSSTGKDDLDGVTG